MISRIVDSLPSVSLEEIVDQAALLSRVDNKYVLSKDETAAVIAEMADQARILQINGQRQFMYRTTYFDTPDLTSFYASAHRRRRKFKVRSREYCETGQAWFEVKTSRNGRVTQKDRIPTEVAECHQTPPAYQIQFAEEIISERLGLDNELEELDKTLTSTYQRLTLLMPQGERVTVDLGLEVSAEGQGGLRFDHQVIMESKSTTGRGAVDHLLWNRGIRPQRISKYATGLALLNQDLPHNRWNRTIRDLQLEPLLAVA